MRDDEMARLLSPYLVRTVRVGLWATAMVLPVLAAIPFLSGATVSNLPVYFGILAAAACGAAVIAFLPWSAMFERGQGMPVMYLWSLADIALITALLVPTGGGRSMAFWVYMMTTIFFAASYPPRVQLAFTGITASAYLAVCALTDTWPTTADLATRLAILVLVTHMGSFLSRELMRQLIGHQAARAEAETHAALLGHIAESARHVNDLDPGRANAAVLTALAQMGLPSSSICVLEGDARWFRHASTRGFAGPPSHRLLPVADDQVVSRVLRTGHPVIVHEDDPTAGHVLRRHNVRGLVAVPVRIDGVIAAVLVGATPTTGFVNEDHIEAVELLASLTGRAMSNAHRFLGEQNTSRQLAEIDAMKSDFLTTVSQELRTPLTAITGVGQLLTHRWDTIDDPTRRELLARSNANADDLRRIILTMLDLSLIQAGKLTSAPKIVDLSALLHETVAKTERLLADHHVSVVVPDGLRVVADPLMLARVVDSLLVNVARHTPPGTSATLWARSHRGHVRVEVADDGPGIDEPLRKELGAMFLRGGPLHARSRGLGLGIPLSMEVLKLHGSELEIESPEGRGTTCGFLLEEAPATTVENRRVAAQPAAS